MGKRVTFFDMEQIPVSSKLNDTVKEAFAELETEKACTKENHSHKKSWAIGACTAATLVLTTGILAANPAFAAKLPLIGSIFAYKEAGFTTPGDFSDKAQVINEVASEETDAPASINTETEAVSKTDAPAIAVPVMSAEEVASRYQSAVFDQGIAIIPTETYCDGISIFMSVVIYSEQTINEQTETEGAITLGKYYLTTRPGIVDGEMEVDDSPDFDAFIIDSHRIGGMMKFDLPETINGSEHRLELAVNTLLADMDDENGDFISNPDHIMDCAIQQKGSWNLVVPFDVDTESTAVYANLNPDDNRNSVEKVIVSPYQLQIIYRRDQAAVQLVCFDQDGTALEIANNTFGSGLDTFKWSGEKPSRITAYVINASPTVSEEDAYYLTWNDNPEDPGNPTLARDLDGNPIGTVWAPKVKDMETAERFMLTKTEVVLE